MIDQYLLQELLRLSEEVAREREKSLSIKTLREELLEYCQNDESYEITAEELIDVFTFFANRKGGDNGSTKSKDHNS